MGSIVGGTLLILLDAYGIWKGRLPLKGRFDTTVDLAAYPEIFLGLFNRTRRHWLRRDRLRLDTTGVIPLPVSRDRHDHVVCLFSSIEQWRQATAAA